MIQAFILELLNEPSWKRYIGDKEVVRTLEDAKNYILTGPLNMYSQLGFGLYLVERKQGKVHWNLWFVKKRHSRKS